MNRRNTFRIALEDDDLTPEAETPLVEETVIVEEPKAEVVDAPAADLVVEPAVVVAPVEQPVAVAANTVESNESTIVVQVEVDGKPAAVTEVTVNTDNNTVTAQTSAPAEQVEAAAAAAPAEVVEPAATEPVAEAPVVPAPELSTEVPAPVAEPVVEAPAVAEPAPEAVVDPVAEVVVEEPAAEFPAGVVEEPKAEDVPAVAEEVPASEDLAVVAILEEQIGLSEDVAATDDTAALAEEIDNEVDQATDAVLVLESHAEFVEQAAANGGLQHGEARLVKMACEDIYQRFGLGKALGIPAMESFEKAGSRIGASTIALESIKEKAVRLWKAIVAAIKKAAAAVGAFLEQYVTAAGRQGQQAKKIAEAADDAAGAPKVQTVGAVDLARALSIGGVVNAKKVIAGVLAAGALAGASAKTADYVVAEAERIIGSGLQGDAGKAALALAQKSVPAGFKSAPGDVKSLGIPEGPDGTDIKVSQLFPGEAVIWAHVPTGADSVGSFATGVAVQSSQAQTSPVLTTAEIKAIADAVATAAKDLGQAKKLAGDIKALVAKLDKAAASEEGVKVLQVIKKLTKGFHQPAASVSLKSNEAALKYAVASLRAYGIGAAAPAKA